MSPTDGRMRIQKFLSRAGVASRRQAEGLMTQGRVRVNGQVVTTLGTQIDPDTDRVELDGQLVELEPFRWILLNKPPGTVTTRTDPRGRPTVYSLLRPEDGQLRYVGRLDMGTEGLLLLTNEGDAIHQLLHPSSQIPREYRVWTREAPAPETLRRLSQGVELEDGVARAENVRLVKEDPRKGAILSLVLREGRKREVRRLLRAVGHPVRRLRRVRFGPLTLGDLPLGEWRELTTAEIRQLRKAAGVPLRPGDGTDVR